MVSYSRPAIIIVKLRSSSNEEEGNLFGRDSTIITHFLNAEFDSKTLALTQDLLRGWELKSSDQNF